MPTIELDEETFNVARRRAADEGFASVSALIADLLADESISDMGETPNLDHFFTPERLAEIDKARADIAAGNYFTQEQIAEHFKQKRAAWEKANAHKQ